MTGPSLHVLTLEAFAGLLDEIMESPVDRHLPLAEQGVDSLALLDLLAIVEDRTGVAWEIAELEGLASDASLADYYRSYVALLGRPAT